MASITRKNGRFRMRSSNENILNLAKKNINHLENLIKSLKKNSSYELQSFYIKNICFQKLKYILT